MQRQVVSSSNLRSVAYDWHTSTLEIEFRAGRIYRYRPVPPQRFMRLMNAGSKGSFFHAHIRSSFAYWRVV